LKSYALIMIVLGIGAFIYCGDQMAGLKPMNEMAGILSALHTEYGRWQVGQYAGGFLAFCGFLMLIMKR